MNFLVSLISLSSLPARSMLPFMYIASSILFAMRSLLEWTLAIASLKRRFSSTPVPSPKTLSIVSPGKAVSLSTATR